MDFDRILPPTPPPDGNDDLLIQALHHIGKGNHAMTPEHQRLCDPRQSYHRVLTCGGLEHMLYYLQVLTCGGLEHMLYYLQVLTCGGLEHMLYYLQVLTCGGHEHMLYYLQVLTCGGLEHMLYYLQVLTCGGLEHMLYYLQVLTCGGLEHMLYYLQVLTCGGLEHMLYYLQVLTCGGLEHITGVVCVCLLYASTSKGTALLTICAQASSEPRATAWRILPVDNININSGCSRREIDRKVTGDNFKHLFYKNSKRQVLDNNACTCESQHKKKTLPEPESQRERVAAVSDGLPVSHTTRIVTSRDQPQEEELSKQ
ncbi:hypothetical protein MAR_016351 [Mya arenaria]|uniref:Uncharacterized protein n=1 Tax=Mya arenaria TaxID=6604 RepID=A0ABY7FMU5_MYAAR|nr:hypothetical protein MAR_016351 [Mya arenaria]